ncbi:MAG: HAD family phosphatase [Planctomycetes bacterium]|nr:HAD family phosphatase [Planctomycetota bacterium]
MSDNGVIFDLDGVLIDSGEMHLLAWRDLADLHGYEMSDDVFIRTFGMQNYQIIPFLAGCEMEAAAITEQSEWKEGRFRELAAGKLEILDGVEKLVRDLSDNGFKLAIGSSTTRSNIAFFLDEMPFAGCFDSYVVGDDVANGKPAPDTFLKAAEKLGLAAGDCVVVEDAVAGVESGKAAGMKVVAVTTTRKREDLHQADVVVDSLAEISAADIAKLLS